MKLRTRRKPTLAVTKSRRDPLRLDPTRTRTLREAWVKDLRRRWARVRAAIVRLVVVEDAFGLRAKQLAFNSNDFFSRCERDDRGWCLSSDDGGVVKPYAEGGTRLTHREVADMTIEMKNRWGYHGNVNINGQEGREFEVGGVKWREAGNCRLSDGYVTVFTNATGGLDGPSQWKDPKDVQELVAHEYMHGTFEKINQAYNAERSRAGSESADTKSGVKMRMDGDVYPQYASEFPVLARFYDFIESNEGRAKLLEEDGITDYSRAYWKDYKDGKVTFDIAVHETLAEMAGIHEKTGILQGGSFYRRFYKAIRDEYLVQTGQKKNRGNPERNPSRKLTANQGLFVDHEQYLDANRKSTTPDKAVWLRWWKSDGTNGWATRAEPTTNAGRWAYDTNPRKVKQFLQWLKQLLREEVLESEDDDAYWREYVEQGFLKGAGRAWEDYKRAHPELATESADFYRGTREQFLKSSFAQPESVEKVKLLAGKTFNDLEGVTAEMSTRMVRELTDGLVQGKHPVQIGKEMAKVVDLGEARSKIIARHAVSSVHAEGQLLAFEALGVEELGVAVEWSTSGRTPCSQLAPGESKIGCVCPLCEVLEGVVVKTSEAHGMLPRHVGCFCSWTPAGVGETTKGQKRTYKAVTKAIAKSVQLEGVDPDDQDEVEEAWGPATAIGRDRPEPIINAGDNCGTGAGGFQPGNTCAKGGEGGVETRTSAKDAMQWVSDRVLTRKGDKVLNDLLPDKVKQLLADSKTVQTDDEHRASAVGVARRWDEGATIKWHEGDVHIALHEMGHAVLYQGKHGDKFASSPLVDHWIPAAEKAIEEYSKLKGEDDRPPLFLDKSSVNEMWADVFQAYVNPRTHLLLKYAMPETHKTLKALLGEVPYDVELSPRAAAFIKDAVAKSGLRKRVDLERHGLTRDSYERLQDELMPTIQGWDKKYTKKEVTDYRERIKAAEALLQPTANFDPAQPRDEQGRWSDSIGVGDVVRDPATSKRYKVLKLMDVYGIPAADLVQLREDGTESTRVRLGRGPKNLPLTSLEKVGPEHASFVDQGGGVYRTTYRGHKVEYENVTKDVGERRWIVRVDGQPVDTGRTKEEAHGWAVKALEAIDERHKDGGAAAGATRNVAGYRPAAQAGPSQDTAGAGRGRPGHRPEQRPAAERGGGGGNGHLPQGEGGSANGYGLATNEDRDYRRLLAAAQEEREYAQLLANAQANCGTGAGGFQPGNTCGGKGTQVLDVSIPRAKGTDTWYHVRKPGSSEATENAPIVDDFDVSKLVTGQPVIESDRLKEWDPANAPPIEVAKWKGVYYITQGNHRVAAALKAGAKIIKARVYDADADQKWVKPKHRVQRT